MCACKAGSVTIVDGLKAADSKEKCPLCREVNFASSSIRATRITFSLLEHSSRTFICSSINQYIISFTSFQNFHIQFVTIKILILDCLHIESHAFHGNPVELYLAIAMQGGVYEGAVHLEELNILLSRRYI